MNPHLMGLHGANIFRVKVHAAIFGVDLKRCKKQYEVKVTQLLASPELAEKTKESQSLNRMQN